MKVEKFVQRQNKKFKSSLAHVENRRAMWPEFENKVKETFKPLLSSLNNNFKFETFSLYSRTDVLKENPKSNQNFIQFEMGSHYIGIQKTLPKPSNKEEFQKTKKIFETGGTLLFTQGPSGEVMVVLYPCVSDVIKHDDEHLVYGIYKHPQRLKSCRLNRIIRFYFRYAYITSFISHPNVLDRMRISLIKLKVGFDILKFGRDFFNTAKSVLDSITSIPAK